MSKAARATPGRPKKFGRKAEPITVRLPQDVIEALAAIDRDVAWAIVKLLERSKQAATKRRTELAGLYQIPGGRALILVRPEYFDNLPDVSLIPLSDGRAFLALAPGKGVADLELAVLDQLESRSLAPTRRTALARLRALLQEWRRAGIEFEARSIIIARRSFARRKSLASLQPSK